MCLVCVCPCCGVRNISQIMTQFCYQIGSNVIFVSVEREREREGQKCVQLAVHQATCTFYKTADFGAQDGMVLSVYCTTDLSLSRSWRRAEEVEILP